MFEKECMFGLNNNNGNRVIEGLVWARRPRDAFDPLVEFLCSGGDLEHAVTAAG